MENYLGVAKELGITEEEIGAIQSVVMAVSAGKIGAQLNEVQAKIKAAAAGSALPIKQAKHTAAP
jgi:hypothetical protein